MNDNFEIPKKIIWLASYPKSGNTWFRAFLTALLNDDGQVDINELKTDGIFSSRIIFDHMTDLDSEYLADLEVRELMPDVYNQYAMAYRTKEYIFIKIHDAYTFNSICEPFVPFEATHCAIYFVRNPLDVATSFANHNNDSVDKAIKTMNSPDSILGKSAENKGDISSQFGQLLLDWSGHVKSWTEGVPFPVMVIKYEDMLTETYNTFNKAVKFIGIDASETKIQTAINASNFEQLKAKEQIAGFKEKVSKPTVFFRKGTANGWKTELTLNQITQISNAHYHVMKQFSYL